MRFAEALSSLRGRMRRPVLWAVVIGGAMVWAFLRLALGGPFGRLGRLEPFLPLPILVGTLVLGPLPWQLGGGSGRLPHPLRGLLQALPWNAAWLLALLMGLQAPHPASPPPNASQPHASHLPPTQFSFVLLSLFLPLVTAAGGLLAHAQAAEEKVEQQRRFTEEARQLALQAQMQPHALFNAISGLAELAREDGEAAESALVALSCYLRHLQKHCQARTQPLSEERTLLESYLAIAQIRLGDRLRVEWAWPGWANGLRLPPLLLQPLVENAVEHGLAASAAGGRLRIFAEKSAEGVVLGVANDGVPPKPDAQENQGLGHLRERLALWSPGRARLELGREDGETLARIHLPQDPA